MAFELSQWQIDALADIQNVNKMARLSSSDTSYLYWSAIDDLEAMSLVRYYEFKWTLTSKGEAILRQKS